MPTPNVVTSLNLDDPQTLTYMLDKAKPAPRFLNERYFPCNPDTDIFPTESILVDYRDKAGHTLAPLVRTGHKADTRSSFHTEMLTPARIAPERPLAVVDLIKRGFGESLFSGMAPSQRAVNLTLTDMTQLKDNVLRRIEKMSADLLQGNQYVLTYEEPTGGEAESESDVTVSFIDSDDADAAFYAPGTLWNAEGANIYADIKAMLRQMEDNGAVGGEVDLVLGSDAADAFLHDEHIHKLLDIRRMEMGTIAPKIYAQGATLIGLLNVDGVMVNVIEYREKYTDANKRLVPFLAPGVAFVANPGCGRTMYAAVTQMEQADNAFHTYLQPIVPKFIGDADADSLKIQLTSRPVLAPVIKAGWVSATVVAAATESTEEETEPLT